MTDNGPCRYKKFVITELFLEMQCQKNPGGTKNLILRGNELIKRVGIRIKDSDIPKIVIFLKKHPEIVCLELPYNEISNCGFYDLVTYFRERPVIRHLNVIGNNIGSRGISYLVALKDCSPLHSLRLSGNKIGNEGAALLFQLLQGVNTLKFLDISDTHQTMSGLAYIMTALMPSRGESNTLQYIDIGRPLPQTYHQMGDAHAAEFVGQVLKDNKILKEIHLQQYQFDFQDMRILLEGLRTNTTLLCLDLNNNNIGDDGVEYLCQYLRTSPPLQCLMIGTNNFGNLGALALSFNLPYSKIKLLDITNNRITEEGLISIFYTIQKKIAMRGLFMWGNEFSHECLRVLLRLFQTNLLDPEHTDVSLYCDDGELKAAWNKLANRYTERFYCVSAGYPTMRTLMINHIPKKQPEINFKYHVDDSEIGFPLCEWDSVKVKPKYVDPI